MTTPIAGLIAKPRVIKAKPIKKPFGFLI